MRSPISQAADLGLIIRAVRRRGHVRLDDLAIAAGVSKQFVQDVEYGKPTAQFGRILLLLAQLGIPLVAEIPKDAVDELAKLKAKARSARTAKGATSSD